MNSKASADIIHFALNADRARAMQRSYLAPAIVIGLFSALVIFRYDFAGEAASPPVVKAMFYGSIVGVYAILGGLVLLERRKAPKDAGRGFLAISHRGIDVDFGRGLHKIPFTGITGIVAVRPRDDKKPIAIFFARGAVADLGRRDRNRVIHKVGSRYARLHKFKDAVVMPIYLFGDDQADNIVAAIEAQLECARKLGMIPT
ncbi:hypothetical protein AN191_18260 [Loktanella sp. 5RATIMAR09]|uniref:hypothetical protein n=1 Tax=Loktanella sp. 5RATIMAR09 TaxID=1225655 RepID=UPI0006EB5BE0|nr:hypothetical protein [Loktanella sp. 5RATIMAR09]KQI70419.1 hypothetical protein AN191_18260 [Loktanella sp. 5RATIMAR09]